ncbi:xenobiotic acyltransferase family protein [Acinetobacter soli]|uniref:xenobiotic acyltransferase family protein n=1 Tax=Acinetobacter soli TaxID=487316 RepID=UPI00370AA6CE
MNIGSWIRFSEYTKDEHKAIGTSISDSSVIHKSLIMCSPIHISPRTQIKNNVRIDKYTFINWDSIIYPNVYIGAYCSIGRGVQIGLASHPTNWLSTHSFQYSDVWFLNDKNYKKIQRNNSNVEHLLTNIGSDVWIGNNALICSGLVIGVGAIIGAGSVVVKDVPPYAIVGGSPAKIIRYRFSPDIILRLLNTKWWLKNVEELNELPFSNVEEVLKILEKKEIF